MRKALTLHKAPDFMDRETKYKLLEKIIQMEDDAIWYQIRDFVEATEKASWDELSPEEKASIEQGVKESESGLGRPHEEVMKELRNRYKL